MVWTECDELGYESFWFALEQRFLDVGDGHMDAIVFFELLVEGVAYLDDPPVLVEERRVRRRGWIRGHSVEHQF